MSSYTSDALLQEQGGARDSEEQLSTIVTPAGPENEYFPGVIVHQKPQSAEQSSGSELLESTEECTVRKSVEQTSSTKQERERKLRPRCPLSIVVPSPDVILRKVRFASRDTEIDHDFLVSIATPSGRGPGTATTCTWRHDAGAYRVVSDEEMRHELTSSPIVRSAAEALPSPYIKMLLGLEESDDWSTHVESLRMALVQPIGKMHSGLGNGVSHQDHNVDESLSTSQDMKGRPGPTLRPVECSLEPSPMEALPPPAIVDIQPAGRRAATKPKNDCVSIRTGSVRSTVSGRGGDCHSGSNRANKASLKVRRRASQRTPSYRSPQIGGLPVQSTKQKSRKGRRGHPNLPEARAPSIEFTREIRRRLNELSIELESGQNESTASAERSCQCPFHESPEPPVWVTRRKIVQPNVPAQQSAPSRQEESNELRGLLRRVFALFVVNPSLR